MRHKSLRSSLIQFIQHIQMLHQIQLAGNRRKLFPIASGLRPVQPLFLFGAILAGKRLAQLLERVRLMLLNPAGGVNGSKLLPAG